MESSAFIVGLLIYYFKSCNSSKLFVLQRKKNAATSLFIPIRVIGFIVSSSTFHQFEVETTVGWVSFFDTPCIEVKKLLLEYVAIYPAIAL